MENQLSNPNLMNEYLPQHANTAIVIPAKSITKPEDEKHFNPFTPEQELLNYQIEEFCKFVHSVPRSRNLYNNPEYLQQTLAGHKIVNALKTKCDYKGKFSDYGYAKGRGRDVRCYEDETVIRKFRTVFSYMPYIDSLPIILDCNCQVIDGMQRLTAAKSLPNLWVTFVMYDIDLTK